jgi:hypothetical protein
MAGPETTTEAFALNPRVRHRAVGEDGVVVHLDRGRVLVVNEVGLRIVQMLQEPLSRSRIAERLVEEFEVSLDDAQADLDEFLKELDAEQVIEIHPARSSR